MSLNATMIRERCVIKDPSVGKAGSSVLSNRFSIPLGKDVLVVRSQNMFSATRMAARLYNEAVLHKKSLLVPETGEYINKAWDAILHETQAISPDNWLAVYLNGSNIFQQGEHHPFLDMIETQAAGNDINYDMNVMIAAETFNAAGHTGMTVDHNSNVALILNLMDEQARCGLIYRHPKRTTTFSFSVQPSDPEQNLQGYVSRILEASADFLESIQVCYAIAADGARGLDQDYDKQATLKKRLLDMRHTIDVFEGSLVVTYRPERPDFSRFLQEAELLLAKRARA